jgi:hypothetical protein
MTPDTFLQRVLAVVDDLALTLAHTPRDRQEECLKGFADRVRTQWVDLFAPVLSAEDVDRLMDDIIDCIRARRSEIEATNYGVA